MAAGQIFGTVAHPVEMDDDQRSPAKAGPLTLVNGGGGGI